MNRTQTVNDYRERLNRVLVYVQDNIDKPLALASLAAVARFSPFHFHRIFAAYIGETLNDHVRRLRLEKAARKLRYSPDPITEIALGTGYETPAAFTRAFRKHFGRNPTEYKKMTLRDPAAHHARKNSRMRKKVAAGPEIRRLPGQEVLFVRQPGPYDKAAAAAWPLLLQFAYSRHIISKTTKLIGISHDSPQITCEEKIRYDACITFEGSVTPEGRVGLQTIAGGRYAVFLHKGAYRGFGGTYDSIMRDWYPESGEKLRDLPCFEVYLNRDPERTKPENLKTEIYVPIESGSKR